jgi:hypothetical protein
MKKLVTLALLLVAASAFAAPTDPAVDGIGIYFDTNGTSNCSTASAYTNVTAYVLATNISESSGVSGWEAEITTNPATFPAGINFTILGGGLNVLTAPNFQVGLANALPYAPAISLLSISTFYLGGPIQFGIGPCTPTSFPARPGPGFAKGSDPGVLKPLTPAASDAVAGKPYFYWVAGVNTTCPVATENDSWGSVKNLYQ